MTYICIRHYSSTPPSSISAARWTIAHTLSFTPPHRHRGTTFFIPHCSLSSPVTPLCWHKLYFLYPSHSLFHLSPLSLPWMNYVIVSSTIAHPLCCQMKNYIARLHPSPKPQLNYFFVSHTSPFHPSPLSTATDMNYIFVYPVLACPLSFTCHHRWTIVLNHPLWLTLSFTLLGCQMKTYRSPSALHIMDELYLWPPHSSPSLFHLSTATDKPHFAPPTLAGFTWKSLALVWSDNTFQHLTLYLSHLFPMYSHNNEASRFPYPWQSSCEHKLCEGLEKSWKSLDQIQLMGKYSAGMK